MSERDFKTELENLPEARIMPLKRISALWLIPLLTLVVGGWMVYENWTSQGPLITIEFSTASGLEAGVTKIKTRDVEVGQVEEITLNSQLNGVIVSARINNEFRDLLAVDSRFWVVQPTITLAGISGLGTLLTGEYIRFSPGMSVETASSFLGLEQPPLTPLGTPGLHIILTADNDISFSKGDLIHYQGINVGTIEDIEFDFQANRINYSAFIEAPYHQLVNSNTRFWKASGIRAELTAQGFILDTGTINSVLLGGLSFSTPNGQGAGEPIAEASIFYVYPNRSAINEQQYLFSIRYWVMVRNSVAGLQVGAPVMHRGVQVGKVLRTDFIPEGGSLLDRTMDIPILIEINPGRLGLPDSEESLVRTTSDINTWISQGLIATIESQNLIFGQKMIELEYDENIQEQSLTYFSDLPVIPSGQDIIDEFTQSLEELLARVNQLPVEEVIGQFSTLLDNASETLNSFNVLANTSAEFINSNQNVVLMEQLTITLGAIEEVAQAFASDSQANQELQTMMQSMTGLIEEIKPLVTELKNRPNALVFPGGQTPEPIPRRREP